MFGNIAVRLLVVVCLSCIVTEAQTNLPLLGNIGGCGAYKPKAPYRQITGLGYVVQFSGQALRCFTLNFKTIFQILDFGIYTSTAKFNSMGNVTSQTSLVIQNITNPGDALSLAPNANGTFEVQRETVIVAYKGDGCNFEGYILLSCLTNGAKLLAVVVKDLPAQSNLVTDLKAQLNGTGLESITLKTIDQGGDCIY